MGIFILNYGLFGSCLSSQYNAIERAWALQTSRGSGGIPQRQPVLPRVTRTSSTSVPVRTIFCLSFSILFQVQLGSISSHFLCMERSWSCERQVTHCVHSTGCYHINTSSSLHRFQVQNFTWQQCHSDLALKQSPFLKLFSVLVRKVWLPFDTLIYTHCKDGKG